MMTRGERLCAHWVVVMTCGAITPMIVTDDPIIVIIVLIITKPIDRQYYWPWWWLMMTVWQWQTVVVTQATGVLVSGDGLVEATLCGIISIEQLLLLLWAWLTIVALMRDDLTCSAWWYWTQNITGGMACSNETLTVTSEPNWWPRQAEWRQAWCK